MKKLIAIALIGTLAAFACACGNNEDQSQEIIQTLAPAGDEEVKEVYDLAAAYLESMIDTSLMDLQTDDEQEGFIYGTWFYNGEERALDISNEIAVNGEILTVGQTLEKDLENLGYTVVTPSDVAEPNEIIGVSLSDNGKTINFELKANNEATKVPISNLPIYGFSTTSAELSIPYNYMGITAESSMEYIIQVMGIPNDTARISTDTYNTSIDLSYIANVQMDGKDMMQSLEFSFLYDPETNICTLQSINYSIIEQ